MGSSYESEMKEKGESQNLDGRLNITFINYICQASPLTRTKDENIHHFFRKVTLINSFTDREVWLFTKFLHRREFNAGEVVFNQGDSGYGFYFILKGSVDIHTHIGEANPEKPYGEKVLKLEQYQYFGEMGLLEEFNRRNATIVARENTVLLGIFKPDLEELMMKHPVLGTKFLRIMTVILAERMGELTKELLNSKKIEIKA